MPIGVYCGMHGAPLAVYFVSITSLQLHKGTLPTCPCVEFPSLVFAAFPLGTYLSSRINQSPLMAGKPPAEPSALAPKKFKPNSLLFFSFLSTFRHHSSRAGSCRIPEYPPPSPVTNKSLQPWHSCWPGAASLKVSSLHFSPLHRRLGG